MPGEICHRGGGMTRFLRVGFFQDKLNRIIELCSELQKDPAFEKNSEMKGRLNEIAGLALEIRQFMNSFPSEPLIWTGQGDTDEVITMLECLVAAAETAGQVLRKAPGSVQKSLIR
jgi:hypothetical protein